jgi:hypothetical protein
MRRLTWVRLRTWGRCKTFEGFALWVTILSFVVTGLIWGGWAGWAYKLPSSQVKLFISASAILGVCYIFIITWIFPARDNFVYPPSPPQSLRERVRGNLLHERDVPLEDLRRPEPISTGIN